MAAKRMFQFNPNAHSFTPKGNAQLNAATLDLCILIDAANDPKIMSQPPKGSALLPTPVFEPLDAQVLVSIDARQLN